jgi:hypothetical protein
MGVINAPSEPPLYTTAIPRMRFSAGSVCATVRTAPG